MGPRTFRRGLIGKIRQKSGKICIILVLLFFFRLHFLLFWRPKKIGENRWNWGALLIWKLAILDEKLWKLVKLRRTPYLKTGKFRRKLVKICEIEAHSLFEYWQLWAAIAQALRAGHRGRSSLGQRPATLFIYYFFSDAVEAVENVQLDNGSITWGSLFLPNIFSRMISYC